MGRLRVLLVSAVFVCLSSTAQAGAATTSIPDVGSGFFAHARIVWSVKRDWVPLRRSGDFAPARLATRTAAARVLAALNAEVNGEPASADPFGQALDAHWLTAGNGPSGTVTQLDLDRGVVKVLGLAGAAQHLRRITAADGWHPKLPQGFGTEQVVRDVGARWNIPFGADKWETWPATRLTRANLAVEAYQLGHLPSYWRYAVDTQLNVVHALPAYSPLKKAVLGFAIRYAGAPYIWGGSSNDPQTLFGLPAAPGFDCSGFVWWVMRRAYTVNGTSWDGTAKIPWRTTYDMAAHIPLSRRVTYRNLKPGMVLFWSTDPHGVHTASSTVYHTGIYLGNGWTINSHGSGAGVTIDYMGPNAGWFHDAFAFGWRVLPRGA